MAVAVIAGVATGAHRRDEYLQAARLAIDPDRVTIELDLTPGIAVAGRVLSEIDPDANGAIDTGEVRAYSQRLLKDVVLEMDGLPLALTVIASRVPSIESMRQGEGAIHFEIAATVPGLADGAHRLHYRNTHRADIGVYLANALVPSRDRVMISNQLRDGDQHDLVIEWSLRPATGPRARLWLLAVIAAGVVAGGLFLSRRSRVQRSAS